MSCSLVSCSLVSSKGNGSHNDEHDHEHGESGSHLGGAGSGTRAVGAPPEKGEQDPRRRVPKSKVVAV